MMRSVLSFFLAVLILCTAAPAQSPLDNPPADAPLKMKFYYNNREREGLVFFIQDRPFVAVDSLYNIFGTSLQMDRTPEGEYTIRGVGVSKYYYMDALYFDLGDICGALGLEMRQVENGYLLISIDKANYSIPEPSKAPVMITLKDSTRTDNSYPVNKNAWLLTLGLTNTTSRLIAINHANLVVLGLKKSYYVSVKNTGYIAVYGGNDTPDTIIIDPGVEHIVRFTFNLPDGDAPHVVAIVRGEDVLGWLRMQ